MRALPCAELHTEAIGAGRLDSATPDVGSTLRDNATGAACPRQSLGRAGVELARQAAMEMAQEGPDGRPSGVSTGRTVCAGMPVDARFGQLSRSVVKALRIASGIIADRFVIL